MDYQSEFDELIVAAGKLATVADQAAVVLSEEFESMVAPSVIEVREILTRCPQPGESHIWTPDGELREVDLDIKYLRKSTDRAGESTHCKIVHTPTGIGRESYTKVTANENYEVAMKALIKAVEKEHPKP